MEHLSEDYNQYLKKAEICEKKVSQVVWAFVGIVIVICLWSIDHIVAKTLLFTGLMLLPYFIADARNHKDRKLILVLGLCMFVGIIPWILALFWSFSSNVCKNEECQGKDYCPALTD